eukprot:scaffold106170_cov69-Phaeocystis_antarctica.AAC.2
MPAAPRQARPPRPRERRGARRAAARCSRACAACAASGGRCGARCRARSCALPPRAAPSPPSEVRPAAPRGVVACRPRAPRARAPPPALRSRCTPGPTWSRRAARPYY